MSHSRKPGDRAHEKRMAYLRSIGRGGFVPAGPVQVRVRHLHDQRGITFDTIAEKSGVDVETVKLHYRGYRFPDRVVVETCTWATRQGILTARFRPEDGYRFPTVGIRRRLQALQAAGFPLHIVSGATGKDIKQIHATMSGKTNKEFVTVELAQLYITAYEKLSFADPLDFGAKPAAVAFAKTRSGKNGYAPPGCWDSDTIDDPDAVPQWTGACGTWIGARSHRREGIPMCPACEPHDHGLTVPGFSPSKLRALRERRGESREGLAEKVSGINASTIQYWESGRSVPGREWKIDRLLSVLDATFEDITEEASE